MQTTLSKFFCTAGGAAAPSPPSTKTAKRERSPGGASGVPAGKRAAVAPSPWACTVCTFQQEGPPSAVCAMCGTSRTGEPAATPRPPQPEGGGEEEEEEEEEAEPMELSLPVAEGGGESARRSLDIEPDPQRQAWFAAELESVQAAKEADGADGADEAGTKKKKKTTKQKLTPMEQQVAALKQAHPGVLLLIEVGYKYRFFGEDATIAAEELGIYAHRDKAFMVASIPSHRLGVHVRRLVAAGHKVGVVKQTETSAIKSAESSSSGGVFSRELVGVYSTATIGDASDEALVGKEPPAAGPAAAGGRGGRFFKRRAAAAAPAPAADDDDEPDVEMEGGAGGGGAQCKYLLALHEQRNGDAVRDCVIGLVAIDVATGGVVFDSFEDDHERTELHTRLSHLQPAELLLPSALASTATETVLGRYAKRKGARVERRPVQEFSSASAQEAIAGVGEAVAQCVVQLTELPEAAFATLGALLPHLQAFRLERALLNSTLAPRAFSSRLQMEIDGVTVDDLELLQAAGTGKEYGSLLWLLNHTTTGFGARLLAQWVRAPLIERDAIIRRQEAVAELAFNMPSSMEALRGRMKRLPDLEYGVARLQRFKTGPKDLSSTLLAFKSITEQLPTAASEVESPLLREILSSVPAVDAIVQDAGLSQLVLTAAQTNAKQGVLVGEASIPAIAACREAIAEAEGGLEAELVGARRLLGLPELQYRTLRTGLSSSVEFLLELTNKQSEKAPKTWTLVNSTQKVKRWHIPRVLELIGVLALQRERLALEAQRAWLAFVQGFSAHCGVLRQFVASLAQLDCLFSLANVAARPGYVRPELLEPSAPRQVLVTNARHPMAETYSEDPGQFVPNDVAFGPPTALLLTGPNMGGKSTYARTIALISVMAQLGSYVPAESARLPVYDAVFSRMGAADDIVAGASTFMVELWQASRILQRATERSLVVLDELGRGTSTHDGVAIAQATLEYLSEQVGCFSVFVTHYTALGEVAAASEGRIKAAHMSFVSSASSSATPVENGDGDGGFDITFLFKLKEGMADGSYGLNVARLAGIPASVLATAARKARDLEYRCAEEAALAQSLRGLLARAASLPREAFVERLRQLQGALPSSSSSSSSG